MNVAIRADASHEIGTGHVMRCLTLADSLCRRGAAVSFLCREPPGNLCDQIEAAGFRMHRLSPAPTGEPPGDSLAAIRKHWRLDAELTCTALRDARATPDLLVVDHYALDERWERQLRPLARRMLIIDDLADRRHDCDVLVDPGLHDTPGTRYEALVPPNTRVFVGPAYALLRPEFDHAVPRLRASGVRRMLVFFGGADPSNEALKLVEALRILDSRAAPARIILGPINPHAAEIREAAAGLGRVEVLDTTTEMARLMTEADLGIGTCGGAAWERCCVGLPALVVISADNQRDDTRLLDALGAVRSLGDAGSMTVERWAAEIALIQADPAALQRMSSAAQSVMRGRKEAARALESALLH